MTPLRLSRDLPIFRLDRDANTGIYVPGLLTVMARAQADALLEGSRSFTRLPSAPDFADAFDQIVTAARDAARQWSALAESAYEPESLTVYLSNRCNLKCAYCFSAPDETSAARAGAPRHGKMGPLIDLASVRAAAVKVARNCRRKGKRFTFVVHGGGEPSLHPELLEETCLATRRVAAEHDLEWWGYVATNGVMPAARAAKLANLFDYIGLSCDGPEPVQARQRPMWNDRPTSRYVERTAAIFRQKGKEFSVRATITPEIWDRQTSIVEYVARDLGCRDIRFEPAYLVGGGPADDALADLFVDHFEEAASRAEELGAELHLSGVRPDELHGPYCNLLRNVLQLMPDGAATNCFITVDREQARASAVWLDWEGSAGDVAAERRAKAAASAIPAECERCVNIMHCSRDCPDVCYAAGEVSTGGLRCRISRRYMLRRLGRLIERHAVNEIAYLSP